MCGGPEQSNTISVVSCQDGNASSANGTSISGAEGETQAADEGASDKSSCLLELAANNDLDGFRQAVEEGKAKIDVVGSWYSRHNGTSQMVLEERTPLMIAALYGSLDVLKYIFDNYTASGKDINRACGTDGSTALHCAAAGGSKCAIDVVKLLLEFGAKRDALDAQGRRPADVIGVSPRFAHVKVALEKALKGTTAAESTPVIVPAGVDSGVPAFPDDLEDGCLPSNLDGTYLFDGMSICATLDGEVVGQNSISSSSSLSTSPEASGPSPFSSSPSSSPKSLDTAAVKIFGESNEKTREYLIDPTVPDIKNSLYGTDEFRMFSFKVRPCSRAYSHDWTECPFVHPGENARRRDPRRYHYSCVPCPDFRKGACRRGDACEYAHGVFECWLHPAQYRTRLCKDGTGCTRRVCFFAHTIEELRPLYVSTGSAVPSLRTPMSLDMAALSPPLTPGSPSSVLMVPPFSPSNSAQNPALGGLATSPMSPSSLSTNSLAGTWSQSNVPALHLPGVSLQASRLRAALNARDISFEDLTRSSEFDGQLMGEFTSLSSQALATQARLNAAVAASACGTASSHAGKHRSLGLTVAPTNLDDLFALELATSPRSVVHDSTLLSQMETHTQSHRSVHLQSQMQSRVQSQLSSQAFPHVSAQMQMQLQQTVLDSPRKGASLSQSPTRMSSFSLGSLSRTSASGRVDADREDSAGAHFSPAAVAARAAFEQRDKRSHSSRDLGAGLIWSDWGSPTGKPEWGVQGDDLCKFRKSASFGFRGTEEPDLSWVQKLVKEGPSESDAAPAATMCSGEDTGDGESESIDNLVIGSWIEKAQLDRIVA